MRNLKEILEFNKKYPEVLKRRTERLYLRLAEESRDYAKRLQIKL